MHNKQTDFESGIIVLGGHIQAYGIIRVLGGKNIPSVIIDHYSRNISRHSKYCKHFYLASYRHTIKILIGLAESGKYKNWVIFPTDDSYLKILSQNYDTLSQYFRLSVERWDIVKVFYNKNLSYPIIKDLGIPAPRTFYPCSTEALSEVAKEVSYPCIIKPSVMISFYDAFRLKAIQCDSAFDLKEKMQIVIEKFDINDIMIQEIIPGYFDSQFSVGVQFDGVNVVNSIVAKRKRQHPIFFGNSTTYAETVDVPELLRYAEKILSAVGYRGICEVEFKYDARDCKYKFLEVNPRLWKWHLLAFQSKIPLLESEYSYLTGDGYKYGVNQLSAAWMDILTDIKARFDQLRRGYIPWDTERNRISAVFNRDDILPFVMQCIYFPCFALSSNRNCGT